MFSRGAGQAFKLFPESNLNHSKEFDNQDTRQHVEEERRRKTISNRFVRLYRIRTVNVQVSTREVGNRIGQLVILEIEGRSEIHYNRVNGPGKTVVGEIATWFWNLWVSDIILVAVLEVSEIKRVTYRMFK